MIAPLPTQSFLGQVLPVQATEGPGTSALDRAESATSAAIKAPAVAGATDQNGGSSLGDVNSGALPKTALDRQRVVDETSEPKFEALRRDMEARIADSVEQAVIRRMTMVETTESQSVEADAIEAGSDKVRRMIAELMQQAQEGYSAGQQSLEPYQSGSIDRAA